MATSLAAPPARSGLIDVAGLRVRYGERWALDGLSFSVSGGEIVGLLGPNGAGKTTTLSVLATLQAPDAGSASVGGHDVQREAAAARRVLGFVPQALAVYPTLTARENVEFFARVLGIGRAARREVTARALAMVGLEERAGDIVSTFSGGMQRRLNLACGLLHQPRALLLDEPTVGVDPQSRERIFDAVRQYAADGSAVLYSTHYMEEAEYLCHRVVLIDHGRVVATGTPADLIKQSSDRIRLEIITRALLPAGWLDGVPGARLVAANAAHAATGARGNRVEVAVEHLTMTPRLLERAAALGEEVLEFHVHQPDLHDVFIKLTGTDLRD